VLTTETITQTATTTLAPVMARAANAAAVAEDIIASVVESGTATDDAAASATKNAQQLAAEQGLSTACSCKLVDPTSTVTVSYPLPPVVSLPASYVYYMANGTSTPLSATESLLWLHLQKHGDSQRSPPSPKLWQGLAQRQWHQPLLLVTRAV
jgi:hypothetical protein